MRPSRLNQTSPVAAAQKALWDALVQGNIDEALQQAEIVERIRGPQPPTPLVLKLIDRLNRIASASKTIKASPP